MGFDALEIHRARCAAEREKRIAGAARLFALLAAHGGRLEALVPTRSRPCHVEHRTKPSQAKRLIAKLQSLGFHGEIKPLAA